MNPQELQDWLNDPTNELHPSYRDCKDEQLLIRVFSSKKHNHCSIDTFKRRLRESPVLIAAQFVKTLATQLHIQEHGCKPSQVSQLRAYTLEELHAQWVKIHVDDPPDGFNKKAQCLFDEDLDNRIQESLNLCELWISSKKLKTSSGS